LSCDCLVSIFLLFSVSFFSEISVGGLLLPHAPGGYKARWRAWASPVGPSLWFSGRQFCLTREGNRRGGGLSPWWLILRLSLFACSLQYNFKISTCFASYPHLLKSYASSRLPAVQDLRFCTPPRLYTCFSTYTLEMLPLIFPRKRVFLHPVMKFPRPHKGPTP